MKNSIVSLPIFPGEYPTLSHAISPILVQLLTTQLGGNYFPIMATNLLGEKTRFVPGELADQWGDNYQSLLKQFGCNSEYQWVDKQEIKNIDQIFDILLEKGYVIEKEVSIDQCKKGCIEMLSGATTYGNKKRLLEGNSCCKCNTPLTSGVKTGLFFKIPHLTYGNIYPKKYAKFLDDYIQKHDTSDEILISRTRETSVKKMVNGNIYNIDVDFFCANFLNDLFSKGFQTKLLVSNPSSLYNAYLSQSLYQCLTHESIDTLVHPYLFVNYPKLKQKQINGEILSPEENELIQKGFKHSNFSLKNICKNGEQSIYQLFIANGLKWDSKDTSTIDIGLLQRLKRLDFSKWGKEPQPGVSSYEQILELLDGKHLTNALNGKRGNKPLSPDEIQDILSRYFL